MATVMVMYVDGQVRPHREFPSLDEAREYLKGVAEEAAPTHRKVVFDEEDCVLLLEYSGDDTTIFFTVTDEYAEDGEDE